MRPLVKMTGERMATTRDQERRAAARRAQVALGRLLTPDILRFVRFCIVGGSGVLINMGALWLLHVRLGFNLGRSSVIAISLAIVSNFLWNNFWTFQTQGIQAHRLTKFIVISLVGMAINIAVLHFLVALGAHFAPRVNSERFVMPSNLIGIIAATGWNFVANSRWTWGSDE
jgi:dolichol-phosphate mannosyltransferase